MASETSRTTFLFACSFKVSAAPKTTVGDFQCVVSGSLSVKQVFENRISDGCKVKAVANTTGSNADGCHCSVGPRQWAGMSTPSNLCFDQIHPVPTSRR